MTTTDIIAFSVMGASSVVGGFSLLVIRQLIEQLRSLTATVGSMKKVVAALEENTNETRKYHQAVLAAHKNTTEITRIAGLGPQAASEAMMLGNYGNRPPVTIPMPGFDLPPINEGYWEEDRPFGR